MHSIREIHDKIDKEILIVLNSIRTELSSDISTKRRFELVATSEKLLWLQSQIALLTEGSAAPAKIADALETLTAEIEALRRSIRRDDLHRLEPEHIAMALSP